MMTITNDELAQIKHTSVTDLTNRTARCVCGSTKPSDLSLGWFEYRGEGSKAARGHCAQCGYYEVAHGLSISGHPVRQTVGHEFTAHGAYEFDAYYCGCDDE